jgi:orotate phosphoribosyltransferase
MRLHEIYDDLLARKGSPLCVALDPPPERFRSAEERHDFCVKMLKEVWRNAAAIKVNENFVRGMSERLHRSLTEEIRSREMLAIYDCKLNDVEHTAAAGVRTVKELGYDAFTFNPIFGNSEELAREARSVGVHVFSLIHPSSGPSARIYRTRTQEGPALYEMLLEQSLSAGIEGYVVGLGAGDDCTVLREVRRRAGEEAVILIPGLGAQGGDPRTAALYGGERILPVFGRTVTSAQDPASASRELAESLGSMREFYTAARALASAEGVVVRSSEPIRLSSGRLSNYYFDLRALYSDPVNRARVVRAMVSRIRRVLGGERFKVATTATAGIPIASLVADRLGAGLVYYRSGSKDHGLGRSIEGVVRPGERFVGVDDLTTTGSTALACVRALRELGGVIEHYFVVLDRNEGASELLASEGVKLDPLCAVTEEFWQLIDKISGGEV